MDPEAQLYLWVLLIAFFTLMALQMHFTLPVEETGRFRGRGRRRHWDRRRKARARKKFR